MLRLIRFECRKIFSSLSFILLLIVLVTANILFCIEHAKKQSFPQEREIQERLHAEYAENPEQFWHNYEKMLSYYETNRTAQNPFAEELYLLGGRDVGYSDYWAYRDVVLQIQANENYRQKIQNILAESKSALESAEDSSSYSYRYQQKAIDAYSPLLSSVEIKDEPVYGWDALFSYESDYFLILLTVCFSTVFMALCDRQNGFWKIANVCKKGRKEACAAKLAASLFVSAGILVVFCFSTFLTIGVASGGYSSGGNAVQAIQKAADLSLFPRAISVIGAYFVSLLFKYGALCLFVFFTFTVTTALKQPLLSLLCGGGVLVFQYVSPAWLPGMEYTQWKHLGLRSLFSPAGTMARLRIVDVFGHAVNVMTILVFALATGLVLSLIGSLFLYSLGGIQKKAVFSFRRQERNKKREERQKTALLSLSFGEWFKAKRLYLVLLPVILLKILVSQHDFQLESTPYERIYKQYVDDYYGGAYINEKLSRIESDLQRNEAILDQYEEMNEKFFDDQITTGEYNRYLKDYAAAKTKTAVLSDLRGTALYLKDLYEKDGVLGSFVYETGFRAYMSTGPDWILLGFVCLFASRFYLVEHEKNEAGNRSYFLVQTTKRGRKPLFIRKRSLCVGTTVFLWVVFKGIDVGFFLKNFKLPDLSAPLVGLCAYADTPPYVSILAYMLLTAFFSLLGTVLLSEIAFLAAFFVKKSFLVYALLSIFVVGFHFIAESGVSFARFADATMLQNTDALFRAGKPIGFCLFFAVFMAVVTTGMIAAQRRAQKGESV